MSDIIDKLTEAADFFRRWPLYIADPESRVVNNPAILLEARDEIERLRAAIAAEREACANIARVMALEHADASGEDDYAAQVCRDIAAAIRSRSKEWGEG